MQWSRGGSRDTCAGNMNARDGCGNMNAQVSQPMGYGGVSVPYGSVADRQLHPDAHAARRGGRAFVYFVPDAGVQPALHPPGDTPRFELAGEAKGSTGRDECWSMITTSVCGPVFLISLILGLCMAKDSGKSHAFEMTSRPPVVVQGT